MGIEKVRHGWLVYDEVKIERGFCEACFRPRYFEVYQGYAICLGPECRAQMQMAAPVAAVAVEGAE